MFKSKYKFVRFLASVFGILILYFVLEKSLLILFKDSWFEIIPIRIFNCKIRKSGY